MNNFLSVSIKTYFINSKLLSIGVVDIHSKKYQFLGKITDINVYYGQGVKLNEIASNPCNISEINIFKKWDLMQWNVSGSNIIQVSIEGENFCKRTKYEYLRLPLKWTKTKGSSLCQDF